MKKQTRRDFIRTSGVLGASLGIPGLKLWANDARVLNSAKSSPALLVIYLRGGADWLNMVVPWKDATYQKVRPTIGLNEEHGIVPLDSRFALHPALAPFKQLWDSQQFAPIVCTGSPHGTRSHFDAQDFMERAAPGLRNITSGWLNRYLQQSSPKETSEFRALAMQELLPRSLRGDFPALAVPTKMERKKGRKTLDTFERFYGDANGDMMGSDNDEEVVESGRMTIETLRRFQDIVGADKSKQVAAYPTSKFGKALKTMGTLIKAQCGLEVSAIDYNGWDHHINQGNIEGNQNRMLADYAASLAAFCSDIGPLLDNTLIVTMTEFGRTVKENGNNGTDHGRGSGMFLMGGGVKGGKVHGDWRGLKPEVLADGRDLPVTTDFRDVMSTCLRQCFDFKTPKDFFPGYKPGKLSLF